MMHSIIMLFNTLHLIAHSLCNKFVHRTLFILCFIQKPFACDATWIRMHPIAVLCISPGCCDVGSRSAAPPGQTLPSVPCPELWAHAHGCNTDDSSSWQSAQSNTAQLWHGCNRRGWWRWLGSGGGRVSVEKKQKSWWTGTMQLLLRCYSVKVHLWCSPSGIMDPTLFWSTTTHKTGC